MNECKNCLYYNVKESRCMNDYNRYTYLVILYRHNCETFFEEGENKMTRDAYLKAKELDKKLESISMMENIISNSTLSRDDEYHKAHNEHVAKDDMILCYMYKKNEDNPFKSMYESDTIFSRIDNSDGKVVEGEYCMHGNFIFGRDIPIDLAEELQTTIYKYRQKIEKEFDNLKDDYEEEDDE